MLQKLRAHQNEEGFTLIEVVTVLGIILVLSAISVTVFQQQRMSSIDSSVETDVKSAALKVETWQITTPTGVPEATYISEGHSEKDTVLSIHDLGYGDYQIVGYNPRGKDYNGASTPFIYDSKKDSL